MNWKIISLAFLGVFFWACQKEGKNVDPPVLTNNPLRSSTDSAVHRQALFVLKERPQMSFTVGVIHNGQRKLYTYGSVIKGKQQLPTENTLYEIGEVTQLVTAMAVVHKMLEKGGDFDAPAVQYIPYLENLALGPEDRPVSIFDLLWISSKIPTYPSGIKSTLDPAFKDYPKEQLRNFLSTFPFSEAENFSLSYVSKAILGMYLEAEYGEGYEFLFHDRLRQALEIPGARVNTGLIDAADYAPGYDANLKEVPHWEKMGVFKSAMGIKATAKDMFRLLEWQLNPGQSPWGKAVTYGQSRELLSITHLNLPSNTLDHYFNNGSTPGFSASLYYNPDQKKGAFFLSNHHTSWLFSGHAYLFYSVL